jgi:flavin reductase ActVB
MRPPAEEPSLREALSRWPSGVTVVTTADRADRPRGFTATSFSSLSSSPPLVLVCLDLGAECRSTFERAEAFAVHILGRGQRELALRFATRGADKFTGAPTAPGLAGIPLFDGTAARLECRLQECLPGGDHLILIGRVERVSLGEEQPLLYHQREFHELPSPAFTGS